MGKVLALIGSNFLGHVTNTVPICKALEAKGYEVNFCIIPLSVSQKSPPISVDFIRDNNFYCEFIHDFAISNSILPPVFNYDDLLFQLNFTDRTFIEKYYQKINFIIEKYLPNIIISDFVFFSNLIAKKKKLLHITIRSHGLKVEDDKEYFNWWEKIPENIYKRKTQVLDCINQLFSINSIDQILYDDFVVTAGFPPFDQAYPTNIKNHFFFTKDVKEEKVLPNKELYLYIRNKSVLDTLKQFLIKNNISYFNILNSKNNQFIDIWAAKPRCKVLISHGGHGMCVWAAKKGIYHIALSDNDDRKSNGQRVTNLGLGNHFDIRYGIEESFLKDSLLSILHNKRFLHLDNHIQYKTLNSKEIAYEIIENYE